MLKYLYIGAGGVIGALLRYLIKESKMNHYIGEIPTGTIFINVFGCFLLAFILAVALEILEFNSDLKLGITTGLLGAFTSFAMFCKETVILITRGLYISAVFYIVISIALAFSAVYAGMVLARKFLVKIKGKKKQCTN